MFKMSMCGVGLLLAGLLACSNQSGLNVTGGSTSGGQGISGTGGSSGGGLATGQSDCERAGGACEPESPGFCVGGWSPNTGGYSCRSSTNFCCFPLSYSPCETAGGMCVGTAGTCPGGMFDDTSQYGCSNGAGPTTCCMPSANGGASGTGGSSGGAGSSGATGGSGGTGGASGSTGGPGECPPPPVACGCPGGTVAQANSDPCGCPICSPTSDAGIAKDAANPDSVATTDAGLSCSLSASQFDNSCTVDSDCVGVPFGDPCINDCASICPMFALNIRVANQYLTDLKVVSAGRNENIICSCPCIPLQPCCRQGLCYNTCGDCSTPN